METIALPNGMHQMMIQSSNNEPQVLQVLSIKDAQALSKAVAAITEIKTDDRSLD